MIIAIGSDHAGFQMKGELAQWLKELGHEALDCGAYSAAPSDYSDYAVAVGAALAQGRAPLGILICGSGQGIAIAANKLHGIRAALCHDTYSARVSRQHNDANILVMGSRVVGPGPARDCVETFLATPFSHVERHERRIEKMMQLEHAP